MIRPIGLGVSLNQVGDKVESKTDKVAERIEDRGENDK